MGGMGIGGPAEQWAGASRRDDLPVERDLSGSDIGPGGTADHEFRWHRGGHAVRQRHWPGGLHAHGVGQRGNAAGQRQDGRWFAALDHFGHAFLGLDNAEAQFIGGDTLTFNFDGATRGFGLYVITGADVIAGDIGLSDGATTVFNSGVADLSDGLGSFAYFLGLVSDADLGALTLSFGDGSFYFTSAVDDVTLVGAGDGGGGGQTVPEPAIWALLGLAGLAAIGGSRRTGHQSASVLDEKELQS